VGGRGGDAGNDPGRSGGGCDETRGKPMESGVSRIARKDRCPLRARLGHIALQVRTSK
jgi:hypothetical protein